MKKIFTAITAALLVSNIAFAANFFDHRIVELKVDVPVLVSNNLISAKDVLNGGDLVIDLQKIADSMPDSGFQMGVLTRPEVSLNINTKKFGLGFVGGIDASGNFGVGKGLFDLLGYGLELYNDINIESNFNADIFAYFKVPVRVTGKKLTLQFAPSLFIPVVHMNGDGSRFCLSNDADGNFSMLLDESLNIYTILPSGYFMDETSFAFNTDMLTELLTTAFTKRNFGLDLEGAVGYKYSSQLNFTSNYRIPIIPAQMTYVTPYSIKSEVNTTISEIASGNVPAVTPEMELGEQKACDYVINRPLKLNCIAKFDPFDNGCFVLSGGLGFGVLHPFSGVKGEADFYPEYYFGCGLSLLGIIGTDFSTSYQEQLFIHKFAVHLSIRIVQVDLGVSTQSSNLAASFRGDGLGAYATVSVGF